MHVGQFTIIDAEQHYKDVWIGNYVHIRPRVRIGEGSEIRDHCFIAPDVIIGKHTFIYQYCNIGKGTVIGDYCFVAVGTITQNDKEIAYPDRSKWVYDPPVIKDYVRIGVRSIIGPGVILHRGCRIGAGAVVVKDCEPGVTYVGVPARPIGEK